MLSGISLCEVKDTVVFVSHSIMATDVLLGIFISERLSLRALDTKKRWLCQSLFMLEVSLL